MFCKQCGNEIKEGVRFCTSCGNETYVLKINPVKKWKVFFIAKRKKIILAISVFVVLIIILMIGLYFPKKKPTTDQQQENIASTVVNIYCEGVAGWNDDSSVSGGSGTIITTDGLVLTNAHIIPQGKNASTDKDSCLVILPDPTTGSSKEMYYAEPYVVSDISEKYDLAFMQINDVYYDAEEGKAYGEYPKKFPAYDSDIYCKNENVKLGEPVRIYGYPAISGGFALTITDGIVSSLLIDEGYIITSAKISHGNSGGLAVDKNGCRIGIPSMVSSDESESLGVIISNNLISDFTEEVQAYIEVNK